MLVRFLGDIELAEEAVQDAFTKALARWPQEGVPPSPAGWIITTARNRALDHLRREATRDARQGAAMQLLEQEAAEEHDVRDERLRLIFTCCHPALAPEAQIALTLRLLGGLTTTEIARAFLVPETTMAQRLSRAKAKIRDAGIPYRDSGSARAAGSPACGPRGGLSDLQRRLQRDVGRQPWCAPSCVTKRCVSGACWSSCCRRNPKRWDCSH